MNKSISVLQQEKKNITHMPPSSRTFASDMAIKHTRRPCNGPHDDLATLRLNRRRRRRVKAAAEQARHRCHELLGRLSPKFNTTTKGTWLEIAIEHLAAAEMTKTFKNTNLAVHYSGKYSVYNGENGQGK